MDKHGEALVRTQNILNLPLLTAFKEFEKLVDETNPQDLLPCLEFIVEVTFGAYGRWDLRSITRRSDCRTFDTLRLFLHPTGPVFKMIYKLVTYWDSKTVYNLTKYMMWARDLFEDGMPEYFMDKVSVDDRTRRITHMSLNAFELYMLHFTYHLVNPWIEKSHERVCHGESLYMQLCIDYLSTFLPCDGSDVLPYVPVSYSSLRSTLPRHNQASYRPDPKATVFRQSLFQSPTDTNQQPYKHNISVWRSEALIYIFVYVWLNYGKQDIANCTIKREPPPSVDHVRVVRSMVKHFHYFANSAIGDTSPMDTLKRIVRPLCADKTYRFLHCSVYNWPLDISFRLILEAWLSYIQPWRYTDYVPNKAHFVSMQPDQTNDRPVDRIWQNFISENLLAYTIIYQQVLPRFARLDLTTVKNVAMLYRVTKVFSQQHLNLMIAEVESCFEINDSMVVACSLPYATLDGTPVSSLAETSLYAATERKRWHSSVQQKLRNLEGPNYSYTPMFHSDLTHVHNLLDMITAAYISSYIFMMSAENKAKYWHWNFFSMLKQLLVGNTCNLYGTTLEDRKRVVSLLEQTLRFVAVIYNVSVPILPDVKSLHTPVAASSSSTCQSASVIKVSPELWQVRLPRKNKELDLSYQGDPDLQPIKSNECAFLVKMFYKFTSKLNEMVSFVIQCILLLLLVITIKWCELFFQYDYEMTMLFTRPGFLGGMARQILSPPQQIRFYDKSDPSQCFSPLVETRLPPRLSLRWLATYRSVFCMVLLLGASFLLGYDPMFSLMCALMLWFAYIALRAVCEPVFPIIKTKRTEPAAEPSELFNLSF